MFSNCAPQQFLLSNFIVPFSSLPPSVIEKVVEKFILELEMQLEDRKVHLKLSPEAKAFIAAKGYDKHFGARPLKRVIQEEIKTTSIDSYNVLS